MILPNIVLTNRIGQHWQYSGMDDPKLCVDKKHFNNYPWNIDYVYNSRGFRDHEWPDSVEQLQKSVWCIGDSFTVGIGSPVDHTWPKVLAKKFNQQTINVSLDGASNNWIARQATQILKEIQPKYMIIHWSYLHRREGLDNLDRLTKHKFFLHYNNVRSPSWPVISEVEQFSSLPVYIQNELLLEHDPSWWKQGVSDEQLRLWHIRSHIDEDIANTKQAIELVEKYCQTTQLIHSFIPEFSGGYQEKFYQSLQNRCSLIPEFVRLDHARDGHHYDIKTSEFFVDQLLQNLG